jgi:serine/threonine protein kinase
MNVKEFVESLSGSGLLSQQQITSALNELDEAKRSDPYELAKQLVRAGKLTKFQAAAVLKGNADTLVFGEYVLLDELGKGGMGEVFHARHRRMDREVAIKVLLRSALAEKHAVERFYKEVRAAAKLIHPNIVTAFDASQHGDSHYLVMEYVDGKDLSRIVKEHGPLSLDQAVQCTIQAAQGLKYAHGEGLVHRDIKPNNLLLDRRGTVKVLDMGLARLEYQNGAEDDITRTGQFMGTVDYISPEQATDSRSADHRSDIYSLGCTLYRLLAGMPIYAGDSALSRLKAHDNHPIPSLCASRADVPKELDDVFQKMVAKRPEDRQQSMKEVIDDLEAVLALSPQRRAAEALSETNLTGYFAKLNESDPSALMNDQPTGRQLDETLNFQHGDDAENPAAGGPEATEVLASQSTNVATPEPKAANRRSLGLAVGGGLVAIGIVVTVLVLLQRDKDETDTGQAGATGDKPGQVGGDSDPATASQSFSLVLDGVDDYVELPELMYDGTHPLTIEAYVDHVDDVTHDGHLVSDVESAGVGLLLQDESWQFVARCDGGYVKARYSAEDSVGKKIHLAGVIDNNYVRLFIDGELKDEVAITGDFIPSSVNLVIGANPGNNPAVSDAAKTGNNSYYQFFRGHIDQVRISNVARYEMDFSPPDHLTPDEETLALYYCDDGQGDALTDSSGKNHHGKITGASWNETGDSK